ncbi:MAG: HAMP domain-containing histidine kinase [Lachnospiraceae bacterium]|nr:HAMP domain-containing histidine kinase [Lachnospiraceae bacterium]
MSRRKRKKISYQRVIIVGFMTLYVTCMLFSTYLMKENYEKAYQQYLANKVSSLRNSICNPYFQKYNASGELNEDYIQEITKALSAGLSTEDKYNQISAVVLGPGGNIVAKTKEYFNQAELVYTDSKDPHRLPDKMVVHSPYDYFTEEEMDRLLKVMDEAYRENTKSDRSWYYDMYYKYDSNTGTLLSFELAKYQVIIETRMNGYGMVINQTQAMGDRNVLWHWENGSVGQIKEEDICGASTDLTNVFSFPYLANGRKYYEEWKQNEFLQNFELRESSYNGEYYMPYSEQQRANEVSVIYNIDIIEDSQMNSHENKYYVSSFQTQYALWVKQVTYPWQAAINYMKYVYLFGFLLMLACMIKTLYATQKAYQKQEELEQNRRDFTNAVAHELKTPIAIVRSLLENMEREVSMEKDAYYRQEGIRQTEVMDDLIKEMIFISKLDNDKIKIRQESFTAISVIEEQLEKLKTLIEEKNLHVEYCKQEDFMLTGERIYLEKAFFNILENAVSYNKTNGKIRIHVKKDSCTIENTADAINEDDLTHVYDMFFTSNKSRKKDVNHKGLGLYLAKRILDMHKLNLIIENTQLGVKATIQTGNYRKSG